MVWQHSSSPNNRLHYRTNRHVLHIRHSLRKSKNKPNQHKQFKKLPSKRCKPNTLKHKRNKNRSKNNNDRHQRNPKTNKMRKFKIKSPTAHQVKIALLILILLELLFMAINLSNDLDQMKALI